MNTEILFFSLSALVNAITSSVLGFYLIFTGMKKRVARYLLFFSVSVAWWSYCYFFWMISENAFDALFWSRVLMIGAIFTSMSYFHLVLVFLKIDNIRFYKIILLIFYFFSFVWLALSGTPYFVSHVEAISYFKYWPRAGIFYAPFLIAFFFHVAYASWLLSKNYFKKTGTIRMQTGLLLVGILVAFVGGSTNYPLWYGVEIAPWGNILVSLYVLLTAYAMLKYKFLDIRVVSAELFTGLLFIIFAIDVFRSKNPAELVFRLIALTFMGLFGFMLIRSVRREVKRREQTTKLAHSLEKANIRLQEIDEQKTEFLSIASHQLRTPLSIIKGYIELIQDGAFGRATNKIKKILDNMDESNERLVKLVDEFLDITRIEQGRTKFNFEMASINHVISSVVKELKERAHAHNMTLAWKPMKSIGNIYMDEEKIRHVIFNYIDNAIKYSEKGSIKITLEREKNGYTVRVKDNGIGFEKEDYANLFQKFYRGKNVRGTNVNGTGLGIYVCRKFIEAHQGNVWGHSDGLGRGSEFGFWISGSRGTKERVTGNV